MHGILSESSLGECRCGFSGPFDVVAMHENTCPSAPKKEGGEHAVSYQKL